MQPKISTGRIDDIEALRAIAIVFTLLQHFQYLFPWGNDLLIRKNNYVALFTGVDLFFAISGFVIGRDLLSRLDAAETAEAKFRHVIAFWVRRVYRIWPSSIFWLVFVFTGSAITNPHLFGPMKALVTDAVSILLQVDNFRWWQCTIGNVFRCGDTTVWWSLSLEEQFYIALPLAILVFRKYLPHALAIVVFAQLFLYRPQWSSSILWWIRTDAISLGVLIAVFHRHRFLKIIKPTFLTTRKVGIPVVLLLVALLASAAGGNGKPDPVPFSTGLVALISALLVLIASFDEDYIVRSSLFKPFVLWLGSRSYAIYLIHAPMLAFTRYIWLRASPIGTVFGPNYTLRFALTWVLLVAVLAEANYRCLEVPFRRIGRRFSSAIESVA